MLLVNYSCSSNQFESFLVDYTYSSKCNEKNLVNYSSCFGSCPRSARFLRVCSDPFGEMFKGGYNILQNKML